VLEVIYYCAEKLDVKIMVIDSLMKCGVNEDDLNRQKKFLDDLAVAARDLNIHLFIVAHSRKTSSDYEHATKLDVAGSANITNLVDNVLSVHRNKEREEAEREGDTTNEIMFTPKCSVHLVKQRHGKGVEAKWKFDFHPDTFSYSEWMS
jgi:twinkle protein